MATTKRAKYDWGELVLIKFSDPSEFDTRFEKDEVVTTCQAVGWKSDAGRDSLKIAWLVDDCPDGCSSGLVIPKGCIIEVRPLVEAEGG